MFIHRLRRVLLILAAATATLSSVLVAGCGSSTVVSALSPVKIVSFGDGFSDLGQVGGARYTVNDATLNVWVEQFAKDFNITLTASGSGGNAYGQGAARVTSAIDGIGGAVPSITAQIDTYLGAPNVPGPNDVFVVDGGMSDITANVMRYLNLDASLTTALGGTISQAQMTANIDQAGTELGAQIRRLVTAGAKYVVVVSSINLGSTPWAVAIGQQSLVTGASSTFNNAVLLSIVDLGTHVLFVDSAYYFNLLASAPTTYGLTVSNTAACDPATTTDAGQGIGTGAGKINSALCGSANVLSGIDYSKYLFADQIYPTPVAHRLLAGYVYDKVRARW